MTKQNDIERKIDTAKSALEPLVAELAVIVGKLVPLEDRHQRVLAEIKYFQDRVDKLTKMLKGA